MSGDPAQLVWQGTPCWRGIFLWYVKRSMMFILLVMVSVLAAYGLWRAEVIGQGWMVLIVLLGLGSLAAIGALIKRSTVYTVTTRGVSWQFGVINRGQESAPISQITNVRIDRSLPERVLGVGRINFDTAGERASEEDLLLWWGIDKKDIAEGDRQIERLRFDHD